VNSSISEDNIYDMGYRYNEFERPLTLNSITVKIGAFLGVYNFSGQKIIDTNNWNVVYHEDEDIYYRMYYEIPGEVWSRKMEFVDNNGDFIFDFILFSIFNPTKEFHDGLLSIPINNANSLLINTSGEIVYESSDITTLYNDVYITYNDSYDMALKNVSGEMISLDYYDKITWHYNSPFIVTHFDGTMQFMDYTGQLLYGAYTDLLPYDGNYAMYRIGSIYYAIDRSGITTHTIGATSPRDILDNVVLTRRALLNNAGEPIYDIINDSYSDYITYNLLFGDLSFYLE